MFCFVFFWIGSANCIYFNIKTHKTICPDLKCTKIQLSWQKKFNLSVIISLVDLSIVFSGLPSGNYKNIRWYSLWWQNSLNNLKYLKTITRHVKPNSFFEKIHIYVIILIQTVLICSLLKTIKLALISLIEINPIDHFLIFFL